MHSYTFLNQTSLSHKAKSSTGINGNSQLPLTIMTCDQLLKKEMKLITIN